MIFRDPNLISSQVQRSETSADKRILFFFFFFFISNFEFTTRRKDAVCLRTYMALKFFAQCTLHFFFFQPDRIIFDA